MQYYQPNAAPHKVVSASGKHYPPLTRPSTASSVKTWRPATTASGRASLDMSASVSARPAANPRYAHVEAKTDTGPNMRKIEDRLGLVSARYKRTECFRRIKTEKLAHELRSNNMQDVLLLDLREKDDFEAFCIRDAHNYPASMLSRSMYQFTSEILEFKNKEGKLMILYDVEEKLAAAVGSNWYEKGIDNFVVLSGGLLALARAHPDLIEGTFPMHLLTPTVSRPAHACTCRPASAVGAVRGKGGGKGGGRGGGAAGDQNRNGNTGPDPATRPATAGMPSATCASRAVPRPVQWNNSLRGSEGMGLGESSFAYARSFESGASLR